MNTEKFLVINQKYLSGICILSKIDLTDRDKDESDISIFDDHQPHSSGRLTETSLIQRISFLLSKEELLKAQRIKSLADTMCTLFIKIEGRRTMAKFN